jgi:hypothetical protein
LVVSVGVKVTLRLCPCPGSKTVPAGGVQVNVPATEAVAPSGSVPRSVPEMISEELAQVIVGFACKTLIRTLAVAWL